MERRDVEEVIAVSEVVELAPDPFDLMLKRGTYLSKLVTEVEEGGSGLVRGGLGGVSSNPCVQEKKISLCLFEVRTPVYTGVQVKKIR